MRLKEIIIKTRCKNDDFSVSAFWPESSARTEWVYCYDMEEFGNILDTGEMM